MPHIFSSLFPTHPDLFSPLLASDQLFSTLVSSSRPFPPVLNFLPSSPLVNLSSPLQLLSTLLTSAQLFSALLTPSHLFSPLLTLLISSQIFFALLTSFQFFPPFFNSSHLFPHFSTLFSLHISSMRNWNKLSWFLLVISTLAASAPRKCSHSTAICTDWAAKHHRIKRNGNRNCSSKTQSRRQSERSTISKGNCSPENCHCNFDAAAPTAPSRNLDATVPMHKIARHLQNSQAQHEQQDRKVTGMIMQGGGNKMLRWLGCWLDRGHWIGIYRLVRSARLDRNLHWLDRDGLDQDVYIATLRATPTAPTIPTIPTVPEETRLLRNPKETPKNVKDP